MSRVMTLRLAAVTAAALTAAPVRETATPPLQDAVAWPEPTAATPLRVNPPTFRWPATGARPFQIELARTLEFRGAATATVTEEFYRPLASLAPGRWYWRVRPAGGAWPQPAAFEISPELPKWDLPDWDVLLARVPAGHPRVYLRPEEVAALRARAAGPLREFVRQWGARAAGSLGADLEPKSKRAKAPPAGDGHEDAVRAAKISTWDDKAGAHRLMGPVGELSWLWMLTGDERFAQEAKRRVLRAARLGPETELSERTSDFANAAVVSQSGMAYDMLYDSFSAAERAAVRAMLAARLEPILRKLERAPRRLFAAHGWQHVYLDAAIGALAIYGEEPRARQWLRTALQSFVALYPWYGGVDGGSAEGVNYYTCCDMLSSLNTRDFFYSAFGLDFAAGNPWYRANASYLIYALPPGGVRSLFGDLNPGRADETPLPQHHLAALRMASLYGDGYAADYARRVPGKELAEPLEEFRWHAADQTRPTPLDALPAAHAFRDIGMAFFHSALTRPRENVRLEFRSSPYGSVGHSHADQNSFNIIAFNEPLIIDSGYYTSAGDRHHAGWTRQTKAHNTLLVDGTGQARGEGNGPSFYGRITGFEQTADWAWVSGSAPAAYGQVKLARFDRRIVWLRGREIQTYVVTDDIEAADNRPHRFDWLLHAAREMQIDRERRRVLVRSGSAEAKVVLLAPAAITIEQTSKFDPPAENWRPDRDYELKDQWHLAARASAAGRMRYVAVIQVARPGAPWPEVACDEAGARVGKWRVSLGGASPVISRTE